MLTLKLILFNVEADLLMSIAGNFPILPLFVQGENAKFGPLSKCSLDTLELGCIYWQ